MNREKYNSKGWLNLGCNKTVKSLENSNVVYGHTTYSSISPGDEVKAGDPLVVMIAMKMEYVIKAPSDGKVAGVPHGVGDFVQKGTQLVNFEEE